MVCPVCIAPLVAGAMGGGATLSKSSWMLLVALTIMCWWVFKKYQHRRARKREERAGIPEKDKKPCTVCTLFG